MLLYNSLNNKKEIFKPLDSGKVKMYVCGITPYDTTHIGHAFTYVFFDTLLRYLRESGYEPSYTQNVTDIDDDILKRAAKKNKNWKELGNFWTDRYLKDMKTLNVLPPTNYVRATDTISEIIGMVRKLAESGFAYEKSGTVYFDISKYRQYGKLSKYPEKEMLRLLKERGGNPNDLNKRNPLDFILWQKSEKNEPYWDSPWGRGRPGWHIECSAMSMKYLGEQIDIHGGGKDLIYPHHESEIAQSESFSGKKPFSRFWLHTAMVRYQGEKMSKSLGNLVLISDLLNKYDPMSIRLLLLSHHYRQEWEFRFSELDKHDKDMKIIHAAIGTKTSNVSFKDMQKPFSTEFRQYLDNDMDIPRSLNFMLFLSQKILKGEGNAAMQEALQSVAGVLGLVKG